MRRDCIFIGLEGVVNSELVFIGTRGVNDSELEGT